METLGQLEKDRKAFDFKVNAEQDIYLLDVFRRLAESRGQAINKALLAHPRTTREGLLGAQLLDGDFGIPPLPPLPSPCQEKSLHISFEYGGAFNANNRLDFLELTRLKR
ncbi:unnamed protein product [Peniophora sp. CBMAI 1063]|nr:unnamed protein product [Peniophora sp. CBMAI 1063]